MHILTWLIAAPFILSLVFFIAPTMPSRAFKLLAVIAGLVPLCLLAGWHSQLKGATLVHSWIPFLSVDLNLSVDSLSVVFLYLSAIIVPLSLTAVQRDNLPHARIFYALAFLLEGLLFAFFTANDLAIFTFFWEAMLVPLYFVITLWGGGGRKTAGLKFLIYMVAGSCLMVAAVLSLYFTAGATFNMDVLAKTASVSPHAAAVCAIFLLAFAVKTPLFPFHAWLPDAYCQAPVAGTVLLSAILSKAGIYGIIRIGIGFFPTYVEMWGPFLLVFAIVGVLYGALAAWGQVDFKRLIAYSSFSHVNFVLAGLFVWNQVSHEGAVLQAFNHGITIAALFLAAGWLESRLGTTSIGIYGGLSSYMPMLCWVTFAFVLSSVALPSTNNFIGELLILFGVFGYDPWAALTLGMTVILSVIYMLRFMQKIYFETPGPQEPRWLDLQIKEWAVALPLLVMIMGIGIYPKPILEQITPAVEKSFAPAQPKESQ